MRSITTGWMAVDLVVSSGSAIALSRGLLAQRKLILLSSDREIKI
jgi:hypothetical protein